MLQDYSDHLRKLRDQLALTPTSVPLDSRPPVASSYRSPSTQSLLEHRTFEEERNQLLNFVRLPHSNSAANANNGHTQQHPIHAERAIERQSTSEKYKEILREVERLSDTVASLHRERSEVDEQWAQRIRQLRAELDIKDQALDEAVAKRSELEQQLAELKAQTSSARRELQRQSRDVEECKAALAAGHLLRKQVDEAAHEIEHRQTHIATLEHQLRERDMQFSAVAAAAAEWEKRYNQAARSRAAEAEDVGKANKRLGEAAKSALSWTGQLAHALSKLGEALEANAVDSNDELSNSLSILEGQLDDIGNAYAQELQHAKTKVSSLVNHCIENVHRRFILSLAKLETVSSEASQAREAQRRSEAKCEQMSADLTQFVSTADDQAVLIDKLRRRENDLVEAIGQLQSQYSAMQSSLTQEKEDLQDQVESQVLELHQQRMRVNELEANITRLSSQRHLLQEDADVTISQLRQTILQKDAQHTKLKAEHETLRAAVAARAHDQIGDESSIIAVEEMHGNGDTSLSLADTTREKEEKVQLVGRLAALERAALRFKEERDAAVVAKDSQERLIMRQEETIVDLVSRLKDGTPPPLMRVKTPSRTGQ